MAPRWTPSQIKLLRQHYPNKLAADVALIVGRDVSSVYSKAKELKLGKSADFFTDGAGVHSRFQPNETSWNKGRHYQPKDGGTRFKKGERKGRANYLHKPVGSLRLFNGFLQQKINEDFPIHRRWKFVHRLVWENVYGEIPATHLVCFKPDQKTIILEEITIERLMLVAKADMMKKNGLHVYYPKELAAVMQLRGTITRKINRIERAK